MLAWQSTEGAIEKEELNPSMVLLGARRHVVIWLLLQKVTNHKAESQKHSDNRNCREQIAQTVWSYISRFFFITM